MSITHNLTIFEGPDGVGKTTAAKKYAEWSRAEYVHFGPYKELGPGELAKIYVEAMMPALTGLRPVVFDRSWLSERPYALVYRNGVDRLTDANRRQLERLAMRCGAVVISCRVPRAKMLESFAERSSCGGEYLDNAKQLELVAAHYQREYTHLPVYRYDWTKDPELSDRAQSIPVRKLRPPLHFLHQRTAGNLQGTLLIVGESFGPVKKNDHAYQWPFGSVSEQGCSTWLTEQLIRANIDELKVAWINADQPYLSDIVPMFRSVATLGETAKNAAWPYFRKVTGSSFVPFPHPQSWKRFHSKKPYPFYEYLLTLEHIQLKEPRYVF